MFFLSYHYQRAISLIGFAILLFLLWPVFAHAASYTRYDYKHPTENNYHLGDSEVSEDGSTVVAIGGTGVIADSEVVVFTAKKKKPAWKIDDEIGNSNIFDVDISADGSTIVACGSAVWLIDVESKSIAWTYEESIYVYDTCTLSDDGQTVVAGNRQSSVFMWDRSSSELMRQWVYNDGGFVDVVAMTGDGEWIFTSNGYSYGAMRTSEEGFQWEKEVNDDIWSVGLNSVDGKVGYLLQDNDDGGSSSFNVIVINPRTGKELWSKTLTSYHTPRAQLSATGHRLLLTTNDIYYGFNATNGRMDWVFERDGSSTSAALSNNGKFIGVTEGIDYVYLLDWSYPKKRQRPFQIDAPGTFPSSIGLSGNSSTLVYEYDDYNYQQIKPGILVDLQNIPVYSPGDDVKIRYHVSNPGKQANLKVRATVSLPQVAFLSDLGATVSGEPASTKGKLLDYANKTLPGYDELDMRSAQLPANDSETLKVTVEMPDLIMPDWLGDLLDFLGLDVLFETLMGDYAAPLKDLVNNKVNDALTTGATNAVAGGSAAYAMLGIGQVQLYDADTNEVYSGDTFYFMYLVF